MDMARLLPIISALLLAACVLPAAAQARHGNGPEKAQIAELSTAHRVGHGARHAHRRHGSDRRHRHRSDRRHRHQHRKSAHQSARRHQGASGARRPSTSTRHSHRTPSGGSADKRRVPAKGGSATKACPGEGLAPSATDLPQIREATLCLVNEQRALHRLPPLKDASTLDACAQAHTANMIEDGYFGHYGPNGDTPVDRMKASGYIYSSKIGYAIGENIAWGTLGLATPKAIVEAWMTSPEHRENILSARYRESGIGVLPAVPGSLASGHPGATYTQDFGLIITG